MMAPLGAGMALVVVPVSAIALNAVAKKDTDHASSIYTLARVVGGNIGYAVVASLVSAWASVHYRTLAAHVTPSNASWPLVRARLTAAALPLGLSTPEAAVAAFSSASKVAHAQARIQAYNSTFWLIGFLFVAVVPLAFLLPKRPGGHAGHHGLH